jgi:hypothetical protein
MIIPRTVLINTFHVTEGYPKLIFVELYAVGVNLEMYEVWRQE